MASARGSGAYALALGEGLDLLARSGGDVRLGFSGLGDLARERLGIAAQQARRLRRNAVALRSRPLLREAVLSGEVSLRKAEAVLPAAVGRRGGLLGRAGEARDRRLGYSDGGPCRVPGCSRAADHVHHLRFRSAGGPLEEWNELSLCAPHHLLGVHGGNVAFSGRAPDALTFVLGHREVAASRGSGRA